VVPDILITKPGNILENLGAYPLGDINGDGKADLALHAQVNVLKHSHPAFYIWTGEDQEWYEVMANLSTYNLLWPYGAGDVNNDGIDDYGLIYGISGGGWADRRIVLYYGSQSYPQLDSLVIAENTNPDLGGNGFNPVGDVNGDGVDDFMVWEGKIWYGGTNIDASPDLALIYRTEGHEWTNMDYNQRPPCTYGDLNGDGYDDVIGSNYQINYWSGEVGIWLGNANMDPNCDLYLRPPYSHNTRQFGWDKAAGDFNADGLCDLAISTPEFYAAPQMDEGYVFVYSGNAELVSNEDLLVPEAGSPAWQINLFPSPFARGQGVYIDFEGTGYKNRAIVSLTIYNLKGQKVGSIDGISPDSIYQLPDHLSRI